MNEQYQILSMLSEGKINVKDAQRLLEALKSDDALSEQKPANVDRKKRLPKYLRIHISDGGKDQVNIRIPLGLIKAGIKLNSVMPQSAKDQINTSLGDKGIQFNIEDLSSDNIDEFLVYLNDLEINVDEGKDKVKIYCE